MKPDKKPNGFFPTGKNPGKNDAVQKVLDEFARNQGFRDWNGLLFDDIGLNYTDCENLATLALKRGIELGKEQAMNERMITVHKSASKELREWYKDELEKAKEQGKLKERERIKKGYESFLKKNGWVSTGISGSAVEEWLKSQLSKQGAK